MADKRIMKYLEDGEYYQVTLHVDCENEVDEDMTVCPHCNKDMDDEDMFYRVKPTLMLIDE